MLEVPGLEIIDVYGLPEPERGAVLVNELVGVHARNFAEYPQVMQELIGGLELPDTIIHPWLIRLNGQPVGEFLFHTSLRRHVVQIHYVSMDADVRTVAPPGWLAHVTDAALATSVVEARQRGVELLGMAGEMYRTPADFRRWRRKGFLILALDYAEPVGGRLWREHAGQRFNHLTIGLRLTHAGLEAGACVVLDAVLSAFLLDYYEMPADHPQVLRMFAQAHELGFTELPEEIIEAR